MLTKHFERIKNILNQFLLLINTYIMKNYSGLNLSVIRQRGCCIKPLAEKDGCLYFIQESDLCLPIEQPVKVLKANGIQELGESQYVGQTYADVLQQLPEAYVHKASAFLVLSDNTVKWFTGLLPEVMYAQNFIINGQIHTPARAYRYRGPKLVPIDD